jgi:hypothetical protein
VTRRQTASWDDLRWAVEAADRIAHSEPPASPVRGGTLRWGDRIAEPVSSPVRNGTLSWDDLVDLARARLFDLEAAASTDAERPSGDDLGEPVPSTHRAACPDVPWEHDEPQVQIRDDSVPPPGGRRKRLAVPRKKAAKRGR